MQDILNKASQFCLERRLRFTEPRALVLKILLKERKPLSAYQILEKLACDIPNPKPPTVYRAIQFWQTQGFVHCIESLKAYVSCTHAHHIGQSQFLICQQCNFIKEIEPNIDFALAKYSANQFQFLITSLAVELKGLCANCR